MIARQHPFRSLAALLAAAALTLGLLASTSSAYTIHGDPWPGPTIAYHTNASKYAAAVDRAAGIWNRANVGVKLRRTSEEDAQVIVRYGGKSCTVDDRTSAAVYATPKYRSRGGADTTNAADGIYAAAGGSKARLTLEKRQNGSGYVGAIALGVRS